MKLPCALVLTTSMRVPVFGTLTLARGASDDQYSRRSLKTGAAGSDG